jgi:transglutaminase-like putative cysteine protease
MNGYNEVPTRAKREGVVDKLVLVESIADAYAHDRDFAEFVLRKVSSAGSGADAQARAWYEFVESIPYRREPSEVLRDPKATVGLTGGKPAGGDCDDLVLALIAGLKSLAIPVQAEILSDSDGWGFHIRARVGLPPLKPQVWVVMDPVWQSERQWAMADRNPVDNAVLQKTKGVQRSLTGTVSSTWSSLSGSLYGILLSAAGIWALWKYSRKSRTR